MPTATVEPAAKGQRLKVFCIESWAADLRAKSTVRPLLELLETEGHLQFIHQRVSSVEELKTYLRQWTKYSSYELGFIALHGTPGEVYVGAKPVTLSELLERTTSRESKVRSALDLRGKTVYFGTCLTMDDRTGIASFRRRTKARLVCGYTKSVDWLEAAAFELLLLSRFAVNADPVRALGPLFRNHRGFVKRLGFTAVPSPK